MDSKTYPENVYSVRGLTGPRDDHVAAKYRWRANIEGEDAGIPY